MKLQYCNKAQIYTIEKEHICDADVLGDVEDTATLRFREFDVIKDRLSTKLSVRFLDDLKGMVYCVCLITEYHEEFDPHLDMMVGRAECQVVSQDNIVQRRQDVKVSDRISTVADFLNEDGDLETVDIMILDISAGGLFCISLREWETGQIFSTNILKTPLPLDCQVLRVQSPDVYDDGFGNGKPQFGYGCKFINLTSHTESALRKYVFQQELKVRRNRR